MQIPDPVVDLAVFDEFLSTRNRDRALKQLDIYLLELSAKLRHLPKVITDRDRRALGMLAHATIGSGGMVGAARLVAACNNIEAACRGTSDLDWDATRALEALMQTTLNEFERLRDEAILAGFGEPPHRQ